MELSNISQPHAASELDLLKAENAKLRKDALRWKAILHSQAYAPSDFANPIAFSGKLGQYTSDEINASADRYIKENKVKLYI